MTTSVVRCRNLGYNSKSHRIYTTGTNYLSDDFGKDIALNHDGSKAYVVASAYKKIGVIDSNFPARQYLSAEIHPNSVDIGPDEELIASARPYDDTRAVWIYNPDDSLKKNLHLSPYVESIKDRGLVVSGDGIMAIAITSASNLVFYRTN